MISYIGSKCRILNRKITSAFYLFIFFENKHIFYIEKNIENNDSEYNILLYGLKIGGIYKENNNKKIMIEEEYKKHLNDIAIGYLIMILNDS